MTWLVVWCAAAVGSFAGALAACLLVSKKVRIDLQKVGRSTAVREPEPSAVSRHHRTQAISRLRQGEDTEAIAAATGYGKPELDLLRKVESVVSAARG